MKRKLFFGIIVFILIAIMAAYYYGHNSRGGGEMLSVDITDTLTPQQQHYLSGRRNLTVGFSDQLAPLVFSDDKGKVQGLAVDLVSLIAQRLNLTINAVILPQNEMKSAIESGKINGAVMVYDKSNMETLSYTNPLFQSKGKTAAMLTEAEVRENQGETIFPMSGNGLETKGLSIIDTTKAPSVEEAVAKALAEPVIAGDGRRRAILGQEPALRHFLKQQGADQRAVFLPEEAFSVNFCLAVSKDEPRLYETLNQSIYKLDKNAALSQLQGKWYGISYPLGREGITERIGVLFVIILASVICVFYIFYGSNKTLYEELANRMEQVLDSKNELQATFDGVSYCMIELDLSGKILNVNKTSRELLAGKGVPVIGKKLTGLLDMGEANQELLAAIIAKGIETGREEKKELTFGRSILTCRVFPVKNAREKVVKILVTLQDVTKEKSAERQMIQDNKMIAVGQLAAGVAHEIRNPLGLIRNYCYVLKNSGGEEQEKREKAIGVIEKAVDKSGRIIDNLLNFSRSSSHQTETVNLKSHMHSVLSLQRNRAMKNAIELQLECDENLSVHVLVESLDMVLINLTANAMDAIIGKREKILETAMAESGSLPQGRVHICCAEDQNQWSLAVEDNGEGIREEVLEEIYNPFFTTKEKKDGNGLGLYIVYNEVQKMNGKIQAETCEGKGTRFTVSIPKTEVK